MTTFTVYTEADFQKPSSNVKQLEYDRGEQIVRVSFKNKAGEVTARWDYWPIPEDHFLKDILGAPSVGVAVNQYLVKAICERRKVG
jgi:hypothetical protein